MTFPRVRTAGTWIGVVLTAELEQIDQNLSRALDGFAGGAYAPTSQLSVGGAGMSINILEVTASMSAPLAAFTTLQAVSTFVSSGSMTANTGFFSGLLTANAGVDVNGNADVSGTVDVGGGLNVTGPTVMSSSLVVNSTTSLNGAIYSGTHFFQTAPTFSAGALSLAKIELSAAGRIKYRVTTGTDADATVSVNSTDAVVYTGDVLTANRILTLDDTGAEDGMMFHVSRWNDTTANTLLVRRSDLSSIVTLFRNVEAGGVSSATIVSIGGVWRMMHASLA